MAQFSYPGPFIFIPIEIFETASVGKLKDDDT